MTPAVWSATIRHGSFSEHRLDAEPHRSEKAGHDDTDDGLEGKTLGLFDALAPSPQVLEVGAQLAAIFLFDSERRQYSRDRTVDHGPDIAAVNPLLFAQRLHHNGTNSVFTEFSHDRSLFGSSFDDPRDILEAAFG